jgi:nicotinamide-nucleotide amidase
MCRRWSKSCAAAAWSAICERAPARPACVPFVHPPYRGATVQAEIVTIGTELLLGEIIDTNSAWIAQKLTTIGLNLYYTTTVGDNLQRITDILRHSLERSQIVIATGGLGPTVDDMTRQAVAAATGRELYLDESLVEEIRCHFSRRGYTMTENNYRQAYLPAGARIIHNPVGTAPAFAVEQGSHVIICLPGVPFEMQYLMETEVLGYLREHFGLTGIIRSRTVRTCGIGESAIDARITDLMNRSNPSVGTRAHFGQTDVQVTAKAESEEEAMALIAPVEAELRQRLGAFVFGIDQQTLADVVTDLLAERGLRLAVVETVTQGELAQQLGNASQGKVTLAGGMNLPGPEAVQNTLGLAPGLIEAHGYPSQEVADAAALAARSAQGADLCLALIGPQDLATPESPAVYYSLALPGGSTSTLLRGEPRRGRTGPSGRGWLINMALDMVRRHLAGFEQA